MVTSLSDVSDAILRDWAHDLAQKRIPKPWEHVSSSGQSLVARNRECDLYCKTYFPRSRTGSIKRKLRNSRLLHATKNGVLLTRYGIDAPQTVLYGTLPRGGEYLFMRTAAGLNLFEQLQALEANPQHLLANKRRLLHDLGTFLGRVHATGFAHGNPSAEHIITRQVEDRFTFAFINIEQCRRQVPLAGRKMLQDLRALHTAILPGISTTDRLRFLHAWRLQMRHLSATDVAIMLRALDGRR